MLQPFAVADEILDGLALKFGFAFDGVVQVGDVSLMMLAVMNLHCLRKFQNKMLQLEITAADITITLCSGN